MSHSLTENTILSVLNYGAAFSCLQDIFRATDSEWRMNWEHVSPATDAALNFLFERGFIAAKPVTLAPYNFVPTDMAREFFELNYGDQCREPRNADTARLVGRWA
jgi:hypothetical protein